MHRKVEIRIVPLDSFKEVTDCYFRNSFQNPSYVATYLLYLHRQTVIYEKAIHYIYAAIIHYLYIRDK